MLLPLMIFLLFALPSLSTAQTAPDVPTISRTYYSGLLSVYDAANPGRNGCITKDGYFKKIRSHSCGSFIVGLVDESLVVLNVSNLPEVTFCSVQENTYFSCKLKHMPNPSTLKFRFVNDPKIPNMLGILQGTVADSKWFEEYSHLGSAALKNVQVTDTGRFNIYCDKRTISAEVLQNYRAAGGEAFLGV
ncbi:MAG: hypothetical protein M1829_001613 [Trizodia sp. TS-e1964]|nr:MAG: hypothetical protein M1829_001613 [Trizodia sp. TS-e1964]